MKRKLAILLLSVSVLILCLAGCNSTYQITTSVSGKGTVTVDKTSVGSEDEALIKIEPEDGYFLKDFTANGKCISPKNGEYVLKNVKEDTEIEAYFARVDTYTEEQLAPSTVTLTFYDTDATEYGVTWHNMLGGQPVIQYMKAEGQTKENADFTNADVITAQSYYDGGDYKNFGTLYDLEFDTEYLYRVGDASGIFSEVFSFKTRQENVESFSFIHTSDSQDDLNNGTLWRLALDDAFDKYQDSKFVVTTGDIVQNGGDATEWKLMLGNVSPYVAESPLIPVSGNHDYWSDYLYGKTGVTYSHFFMDLPEQDTTYGMFYSFDYGNAHFVVLNTGDSEVTPGGLTDEQLNWLKQDLENSEQTWKIIAMHNPLYSPGKYGSAEGSNDEALLLQEQLNELFVDRKVDLVLTGHDHLYSRTYPVSANGDPITDTETETADFNGTQVEYLVNPEGPVHLASGCSGVQGRIALDSLEEKYARMFQEQKNMDSDFVSYSAINIDGNRLTVNYYMVEVATEEAELISSWGIQK